MRIVLDTNVLIAAFISRGACAELLEYCVHAHELVTSEFILKEFRANMAGKFGLSKSEVSSAVKLLKSRLIVAAPAALGAQVCRDADDDAIIGTAVSGACACVVTGDRDLLDIGEYKGVAMLSPSAFWEYESDK